MQATMAPGTTNWLSFSLSPMEMLRSYKSQMLVPTKLIPHQSSSSAINSPRSFYHENFNDYVAEYSNVKAQIPCMEQKSGINEIKTPSVADLSVLPSSLFHPQIQQQTTVPKLEDFLGGHSSSSLARYSDNSQTETQDSSLSNVYDQGSNHFGTQQQDLKTIAQTTTHGFQTFSTNNSGSEVEDSSVNGARLTCRDIAGNSLESGNELVFSDRNRALSLGTVVQSSEEGIVAVVDSQSSTKVADTFGQRTSVYRGVTRHRWTGRYEAHLWDNSCRREGQTRKGRQVYLGGYDKEEKAARAYDLAALKYWGSNATTNFSISNYTKEMEDMKHMTKQEFIASLRRKSSGFSRGASIYRGVTRHHQQGRWQARIGRVAGNKDLYLGTFATEEEAAEAYDIAAIKFRGVNAVTNFEMNRYDVEAIAKSALPIGAAAKRLKLSLESENNSLSVANGGLQQSQCNNSGISINAVQPIAAISNGIPLDTTALYHQNLFHHHLPYSNVGVFDCSGPNSSVITSTTAMPSQVDLCSRSFFYGLNNPVNMSSHQLNIINLNNNNQANVDLSPWNLASSSST